MTDKQLRSMDKIQLLNIMRQQELEIAKLTVERDELAKNIGGKQNPVDIESVNSVEDSYMLASGIIQSSREAAELYLKNIRLLEAEKITADAEQKNKDVQFDDRATIADLKIVAYMYMNFICQSHSILHEMIERYNLTEMLKINEPKQISQQTLPGEFI